MKLLRARLQSPARQLGKLCEHPDQRAIIEQLTREAWLQRFPDGNYCALVHIYQVANWENTVSIQKTRNNYGQTAKNLCSNH